jgi:hypothetical protein
MKLGIGLMLMALAWAKDASTVPSMEAQKNYFKELAVYQGINAEIQEAQKRLALDQPLLEEQRKKVIAAAAAACGDKAVLDQQKLAQGEMVCGPKETDKPKKEK